VAHERVARLTRREQQTVAEREGEDEGEGESVKMVAAIRFSHQTLSFK